MSAASANDPTTVATLGVVGATTGYGLCWLVVLLVPMLALVQSLAAAVGGVCGTSLQGAIRRHYGVRWAFASLALVAVINIATLAADIRAGCEALALLVHLPAILFVVPFVALVALMLVSQSYSRIERYLSLLPLLFLCYVASAILARSDFAAFVRAVIVPHFSLSPAYAFGAIALIGTTLTSYVYIWESIEVAERHPARASIRFLKRDAVGGMLIVGTIFAFVLVASAATLGVHHSPVETASDMAATLTPLAGPWAGTLFGLGLLGSAILAVPVIASTTAYVAAHTFEFNGSLDCTYGSARTFYGVVLGSLALAGTAAFLPLTPIAMLYGASIAGGLATPLTLAFLVLLARDRTIMGNQRVSTGAGAVGWTIVGFTAVASVAFAISSLVHPS